MVYIDPNIDNNTFTAFSGSGGGGGTSTKNVKVSYNSKGIHDVTNGNVPLVSIKENSNVNNNGSLYSSTVNLTLNGKILAKPGMGATGILAAVTGLRSLFFGSGNNQENINQYNGLFEIFCGTTPNLAFSATGVRVINLSIDESGDNWTQGADYSVELQYNIPRSYDLNNSGYYVKSTIDSWNIEPLEDYAYYGITGIDPNATMRQEYHNPKLKPTAAVETAPQPVTMSSAGMKLKILNIPQYKVSRKLSAVGLPSHSGASGTFYAYQNAQKWVMDRLRYTHRASGTSPIHVSLNTNSTDYLYNHLRTTNFSIYDGSYEINESWLAMPINIGYVEDYTVSVSTEEGHIKTVKIQGEIKGLIKANNNLVSGVSGIIPTSGTASINLNQIMLAKPETSGVSYSIPDASSVAALLTDNSITSHNTVLKDVKYFNARDGWINDIKPYLFRRANLVMHSTERDRAYINNVPTSRPRPNNPIYSYERPLNLNPISTSETHDPRKGVINYTYEYTNKFKYFNNTIAESITITDTHPSQAINEAFVLGRRLGPVLQDLGTITSARKEISLEVIVVPPSSIQGAFMSHNQCPLYIGGELYNGISGMINQLKPFGDRPTAVFGSLGERSPLTGDQGNLYVASDTHSWEPAAGVYRRNVAWIYQHCTVTEQTLDQ
jgi:hypothetical protein